MQRVAGAMVVIDLLPRQALPEWIYLANLGRCERDFGEYDDETVDDVATCDQVPSDVGLNSCEGDSSERASFAQCSTGEASVSVDEVYESGATEDDPGTDPSSDSQELHRLAQCPAAFCVGVRRLAELSELVQDLSTTSDVDFAHVLLLYREIFSPESKHLQFNWVNVLLTISSVKALRCYLHPGSSYILVQVARLTDMLLTLVDWSGFRGTSAVARDRYAQQGTPVSLFQVYDKK